MNKQIIIWGATSSARQLLYGARRPVYAKDTN